MNSSDSAPTCRLRGAAEETIAHVLQAYPWLHNVHRTLPSLPERLGLSGHTDETNFDLLNSTKTLLLRWDRLNRGAENTPARKTPYTPYPSSTPCTGNPSPGFYESVSDPTRQNSV
ncbi:hypothetical protein MRX96_008872 [Rhipicephalus microplus]